MYFREREPLHWHFFAKNLGSKPPAAKKAKIDSDENGSFDVAGLVKSKTVDKLKVDDLKQIVKKLGIFVTGKKKAELVEDVYKNYVP
jgi:hypothetical protein